ncbi:MAG: DUF488 domain-containing protein [Candidatus Bathyarchaeia archaeon]
MQIFTIGHSTRTIDELCEILSTYQIVTLADVRSFPRSFKNRQFNTDEISHELMKHGIQYVWLQKLGGRRKGLGRSSKNTCWKNRSFRNYADYMETEQFMEGIGQILQLGENGTTAIMCAESLYWRCHRSMIADFLKSKGVEITHIFDGSHSQEHGYTECARVVDGRLSYHE